MTSQEEALASLARLLEQHQLDYMVIGGLANAVWGEPRATLDIDVTIAAETSDTLRVVTALESEFRVLTSDPASFVRETRVLPLESGRGIWDRISPTFQLSGRQQDYRRFSAGSLVARTVPSWNQIGIWLQELSSLKVAEEARQRDTVI